MRVASADQARRLAQRLTAPDRRLPLVVISIPSDRHEPWIDASEVAGALSGLAEVVVLAPSAAWELSRQIPERTRVYGGAGRAYPPGRAWLADETLAPLVFAYGAHDADRSAERLITAAMAQAPRPEPAVNRRRSSGVVRKLIRPSRALVALEDGDVATIWSELTVHGVEITDLVREGQRVTGSWDPVTRRLDIAEMVQEPPWGEDGVPLPDYLRGSVVLARVREVRADVVHLALHPKVVIPVPKDRVTSNPRDLLTELFTAGETVLARVGWRDAGRIYLRCDDIEDHEPALAAPALIEGGVPWLSPPAEPEPEAAEPEPTATSSTTPRVAGPAPASATSVTSGAPPRAPTPLDLFPAVPGNRHQAGQGEGNSGGSAGGSGLERQLEVLAARAEQLEEENRRLEDKVRNQRAALRAEKQRGAVARARRAEAAGDVEAGPFFRDPEDEFRWEVTREWVERIAPEEKEKRPLVDYTLGPAFLESLATIHGVERGKVVTVVVEVVTGLAEHLNGREVHQLRRSEGGGTAPLTRDGGWTAWRVALQRETAAARRLHYWRRGSEYEFAQVAYHDQEVRM